MILSQIGSTAENRSLVHLDYSRTVALDLSRRYPCRDAVETTVLHHVAATARTRLNAYG